MSNEELRDGIWNYLYQENTTKSVDEIAALAAVDAANVRAAVDHEWFSIEGEQVSIAYASTARR